MLSLHCQILLNVADAILIIIAMFSVRQHSSQRDVTGYIWFTYDNKASRSTRSKYAYLPVLIHFFVARTIYSSRFPKSGVSKMHEALCSWIRQTMPRGCDIRVENCRLHSRTFFRARPQRRKKKTIMVVISPQCASCVSLSLSLFFFFIFYFFFRPAQDRSTPKRTRSVTDIRVPVDASVVHG